jgi:AcrR family transcriptional regulator
MSAQPHRPLESVPPTAGERARAQLMEAAGQVFADKGYSQATSKEICERAGMNAASVNYHFGGFDPLYAATLAKAHDHLIKREELRDIAARDASPKTKLRAYIALVVGRLARPTGSWEMRMLSREIVSGSPIHNVFLASEIAPKMAVLRQIIGALIGAAPDDPIVGQSMLMVMSPSMILAIANRDLIAQVMPGIVDGSDDIDRLIDHFERFIHGGLEAVAAHLRAETQD